MSFRDRAEAGRRLGQRLAQLRGGDAVVLGVARGGAAVAYEVARVLAVPLDVVVVQRLVDPFVSGLTLGAVAEGGVVATDRTAVDRAGIDADGLARMVDAVRREVAQRGRRMRAGRAPVPLARRTAVVVDDGVGTGMTARAACRSVRARHPDRIVLAVPLATIGTVVALAQEAEEVVSIGAPAWLPERSRWYRLPAPSDEEVAELLHVAAIHSPYRPGRRTGATAG
ncbi:phosphoribosyltransferase [Plantactinospora sp. WMMB334]|uniref:phosphoribosyltransferase n=1 Tax=Plantactinospora sp. WMMB334 TaxID=3404119 RepID=UPI003B93CB63